MAREFNITAADKFFLGEDKFVDFTIFDQDGVTPLDVTGATLEWSLRKTDKADDPALLLKVPTVVGVFNLIPASNTQRVRLTFASSDTTYPTSGLKANFAYRHSLKITDIGSENILSYGSMLFLQATER